MLFFNFFFLTFFLVTYVHLTFSSCYKRKKFNSKKLAYLSTVPLNNENILLLGGTNGKTSSNKITLYNPQNDQFTPYGSGYLPNYIISTNFMSSSIIRIGKYCLKTA